MKWHRALPWVVRALMHRPLTAAEEFLEMLVMDADPLIAEWARSAQGQVRETADLLAEVEHLEQSGGEVAEIAGQVVRHQWVEFGGRPLPERLRVGAQRVLSLN